MATNPFEVDEEPGQGKLSPIVIGLLVAVAVLIGSTLYLFLELKDTKSELAQRFETLQKHDEQLAQLEGTVNRASREVDTRVQEMKTIMTDAEKQIDEKAKEVEQKVMGRTQTLAKDLEQAKTQHTTALTEVGGRLEQLQQVTTKTGSELGSLTGEVDTVKGEVQKTRAELDKTIKELSSVKGDLGVQSGLIATNSTELNALRQLGERNYFEFDIQRAKEPQRVGSISVQLRKTDVKRNKFNIDLWVDDKRIEKKDKTLLEPLQFYVQGARQPYELVVNQISNNRIAGYLATPKVEQRRTTAAN
jgi:DNA repair exonuclease SbcCD ATPase subunit